MPNRPDLPELSWRSATTADAAALSIHHNRCADADGLSERISEEGYLHELSGPDADLDRKTLLAVDAEGVVAARSSIWLRYESEGERRAYVFLSVAPEWRGRGLGAYLGKWGVDRAEELLGELGTSEATFVCAWLYERQREQIALMQSLGLEPVRYFHEMERRLGEDIPPARAVEGIDIVPWRDVDDLATLRVSNSAFADHWGSSPYSEASWAHDVIADPNFRRDLSFVAVDGDTAVGYTKNGVYPEDWEASGRSEGWIESLGVLAEYRGRGIASALLAQSLMVFRDDGLDVALLGVDAANPTGAFGLYEHVGFTTRHKAVTLQKPVSSG